MKSLIDRIKELQQHFGYTNHEFAEQLGISPAALSHIYSGRNNPSMTILEAITSRFPDVNLNYLLKGKGELFEQTNKIYDNKSMISNYMKTEKNADSSTHTHESPEKVQSTENSKKSDTSLFTYVNNSNSQIIKVALFTRDGKVFFFTPTSDNPLL